MWCEVYTLTRDQLETMRGYVPDGEHLLMRLHRNYSMADRMIAFVSEQDGAYHIKVHFPAVLPIRGTGL